MQQPWINMMRDDHTHTHKHTHTDKILVGPPSPRPKEIPKFRLKWACLHGLWPPWSPQHLVVLWRAPPALLPMADKAFGAAHRMPRRWWSWRPGLWQPCTLHTPGTWPKQETIKVLKERTKLQLLKINQSKSEIHPPSCAAKWEMRSERSWVCIRKNTLEFSRIVIGCKRGLPRVCMLEIPTACIWAMV